MLIHLSSFFFACMGVVVKWLALGIPSDQVALMRSLLPALALVGCIAADVRRLGRNFRRVLPWLLLRGLLGSTSLVLYFRAISLIELSNAALLVYTSPIFATLAAHFVLHEPLTRRHVAALAVAFCGVTLVVKPTLLFGGHLPPGVVLGTLYGLAAGMCAGCAYTAVRHLAATCSTFTIVGVFGWVGTLVCIPLAAPTYVPPTPFQWLALLLVAVLATLGQYFMTRGYAVYRTAHASTMNLSAVVFATIFGLICFHEIPDATEVAGLILTLGGIALISTGPDSNV